MRTQYALSWAGSTSASPPRSSPWRAAAPLRGAPRPPPRPSAGPNWHRAARPSAVLGRAAAVPGEVGLERLDLLAGLGQHLALDLELFPRHQVQPRKLLRKQCLEIALHIGGRTGRDHGGQALLQFFNEIRDFHERPDGIDQLRTV